MLTLDQLKFTGQEQPFAGFHASLRRLLNLDRHELPFLTGEDWHKFRTDPFRFFIRCDDETAGKIWAVMEKLS